MNWQEYKKELMQDPEFVQEYEALELEHQVARAIIEMRIKRNLSQAQLARLVNTKQPSISRLESGASLPSLRFLDRIAKAVGARLEIRLTPED